MADQRQFIYELPEKLEVLMHDPRAGSWTKLQKFSGISIATLKQVRTANHDAYSRLGPDHQRWLAEAFSFPLHMPEWISPDRVPGDFGPGADTAAAFAAEYRRRYAGKAAVNSEASNGADSVENAKLDAVRDVTTELVAGKRRPASSPLGTMAQVALDLGQPSGAGAHQILVEVSCHKGNIIGSSRRFSVRRALLSIECGDARGRRSALAGINGMPVVLQNSCGETRFEWAGTERLLRWEVATAGAMIGYMWFDAGVVEQLAPGDILRVTLSAWLKHIEMDEIDDDPPFGVIDASGSLLRGSDTKLTIEQRRIIEHVNKLKLKLDDNGQAELAAAELELVRKA